ncbi:MAG: hypothetical protein MJ157_03915, partial [Clostridia bacterium]|nr:hypothetical protein [Clostridia bacterium]
MSKNSINCKFLGIILTFALLMSLFSGIAAAEEDLMLEEDLVLLEEPEFSQDLPEEPVLEEFVPETERVESSSNANLNEMDLYDNSYAPVLSKDLSEETVNYFLTQSSGALSVEVDKDSLIGTGYLTYLWQASSNGQSNWQNLSEDLEDNASWQPDTDQLGTTYYRVKVTYHYQVNTTPIVPFEGGTASTYSKVTPVAVSGINLDFGDLVMLEEVSGHNSSGLPYGSTFQGKLQGKGVYQVPASSGALKIEGTYGDLQYNPANGEFTMTDIQSNLVIGAKA